MSLATTRDVNPESLWRNHALTALEDAVGQPLLLWRRSEFSDWRPAPTDPANDGQPPCAAEQLNAACDEAADSGTPAVRRLGPGARLLATPLPTPPAAPPVVAVGVFETDDEKLLVRMASLGQRYYRQQQNVARLTEENRQFLQQISDDFEELTFLRSVAGRLSLADADGSVEQLIGDAAPSLGAAVRAEALYFVDLSNEGEPRVATRWSPEGQADGHADTALRLIERFGAAADTQPVIRNYFQETPDGSDFPEVREFVLASVTTGVTRIGWFVVVNRLPVTSAAGARRAPWRLSQLEFGTSEAFLLSTLGAMIASHDSNLSLFRERESLLVSVVRTLVSAVEAKDVYTCGHSERVALYARRLAERLGYAPRECELLYFTGLLHDVGKIAVSDAVLNKPDRLTDDEFAEIMRHPEEGWKILHGIKQLSYVLPGVLHHHERPDGAGYPDGLVGEQIPMDGRVLAVADAYDAMTSDRPYRSGMTQEQAERVLRDGAGVQWDADVVDAFFEVMPEIVAIRTGYQRRRQPVRRTPASAAAD